jgi:hypothetical protein
MTFGISATTALALGTVAAGYMGAEASKSSARTQAASADRAMAQERKMFDIGREDLRPARELGYVALKDIQDLMPMFTQQFGPAQLEQYLDPSMAFRMKYGTQATERLANVGGGAISGNTMRGLQEFGQNLASTEYANAFNRAQTEPTNIFNRLSNIAGLGQNAVNTGVGAGQTFAANQTGLLTGQAAALAGGQVGAANAMSGAVQGLGNQYYLSQLMNRPGTVVAPAGGTPNSAMATQAMRTEIA